MVSGSMRIRLPLAVSIFSRRSFPISLQKYSVCVCVCVCVCVYVCVCVSVSLSHSLFPAVCVMQPRRWQGFQLVKVEGELLQVVENTCDIHWSEVLHLDSQTSSSPLPPLFRCEVTNRLLKEEQKGPCCSGSRL